MQVIFYIYNLVDVLVYQGSVFMFRRLSVLHKPFRQLSVEGADRYVGMDIDVLD